MKSFKDEIRHLTMNQSANNQFSFQEAPSQFEHKNSEILLSQKEADDEVKYENETISGLKTEVNRL